MLVHSPKPIRAVVNEACEAWVHIDYRIINLPCYVMHHSSTVDTPLGLRCKLLATLCPHALAPNERPSQARGARELIENA
eukprot:1488325-Amphidinium_carterae.1